MTRQTVTRPEVRVGGQWLSGLVLSWGDLRTSTRLNGAWEASWQIVAPEGFRHPALTFGALVEVHLGPEVVWAGTLDEPDWESGQMVALGAPRDGDDAIALDATGKATTVPNTAVDEAITRGVLPWTRVGNFGTTAVGDDQGGLVKLSSVLDAWADENDSNWRVDNRRRLVASPTALATPSWHVMPGSGDLGQAADSRADRVFVRYVSDSTGKLATASFPATTPASGIEAAVDVTDRGRMSATKAADIAEARWNLLQGESGWTNGLTLAYGQVTTPGGVVADLSQVRGGQTVRLLGVRDPRTGKPNLDVVIGETDYNWAEDTVQVNPTGLAARTEEAVLESVTELAADAIALTGGRVPATETPYALGYRTTTATFASGSWINFGVTTADTTLRGGMTYTGATGAFTVPVDGVYEITMSNLWDSSGTGYRAASIISDGHVPVYDYRLAGTGNGSVSITVKQFLTAGSDIQPQLRQESGGNLSLNTSANGFNFVSISYLGP